MFILVTIHRLHGLIGQMVNQTEMEIVLLEPGVKMILGMTVPAIWKIHLFVLDSSKVCSQLTLHNKVIILKKVIPMAEVEVNDFLSNFPESVDSI